MSDRENYYEKEIIRLHRQRVLMACVIRAQYPQHLINDKKAVVEIICEFGELVKQVDVEHVQGEIYAIEMPSNLKHDVRLALSDYLKNGGSW